MDVDEAFLNFVEFYWDYVLRYKERVTEFVFGRVPDKPYMYGAWATVWCLDKRPEEWFRPIYEIKGEEKRKMLMESYIWGKNMDDLINEYFSPLEEKIKGFLTQMGYKHYVDYVINQKWIRVAKNE